MNDSTQRTVKLKSILDTRLFMSGVTLVIVALLGYFWGELYSTSLLIAGVGCIILAAYEVLSR